MKYLKKFQTNADYQAFKSSSEYVEPNLSAIENDNTIFYEPVKPTLITFTISNIEYQAEEGMTWEEWCNSEYNKNGFYIKNSAPYAQNGITVLFKNNSIVYSYDTIIEAEYIIQSHSGGVN
jgi:hypothetical protein